MNDFFFKDLRTIFKFLRLKKNLVLFRQNGLIEKYLQPDFKSVRDRISKRIPQISQTDSEVGIPLTDKRIKPQTQGKISSKEKRIYVPFFILRIPKEIINF
ncbi:hypothetical protein A0128_15250 [Leptospira tipperaryensis]|uniref:Uncharacterized protein n=1 Tax=Leptospira tipperaryensis TaxID=2564040 RepID=A0A1D7UZS3_9LEPT|nr:hypothetical protein A0128_15250 [Leptospira tipperaryensis]